MASAAIFSSLRRRRSPSLEAFLAPVNLNDVALLQTLLTVSSELVSNFAYKSLFFQRGNSRSLVRRIQVFVVLLEALEDEDSGKFSLPSAAVLCLKELYLLFYRGKILLDYCSGCSKLWLLLQNQSISGHFHDLNQEILTLLDVFPVNDVGLSEDVREHIELLVRQCRRGKLYVDRDDEELRIMFYWFLDEFQNGRVPSFVELRLFFVERVGLRDAKSFRSEIEFLEEQIVNQEGDLEPTASVLNGFVAILRYARFLLFGFEEDEVEVGAGSQKKWKRRLITQEIANTFVSVPKDFCCPISLDLMRDPVIVSTGQTFDRSSISRWVDEGHCSCPKTGQTLEHTRLVPNRALRNLIMHWSTAHGILCDPPDSADSSTEAFPSSAPARAALEANKATAALLIQQLENGSEDGKTVAAREIRLLAKSGKENRAFIAEAGGISFLRKLLSSPNPVAQENSVTAMLNLSIYEKNKKRIMDEEGCLSSIVEVLRLGLTTEARENAAATLFSLSAVHVYKKTIAEEGGAVESLAGLLRDGTLRGKKDAVTALFNLCTHSDNCMKMIEAGAVTALVGALENEGVAEEAAAALGLIVRKPIGAEAVMEEETAVAGLTGMMRCGTPRGKENAVAALLLLCRNGGAGAIERVIRTPALACLLQSLLFTGTKRARRKAASLARVFRRCDNIAMHFVGPGRVHTYSGSSDSNSDSSFVSDVSVLIPPSLPVS